MVKNSFSDLGSGSESTLIDLAFVASLAAMAQEPKMLDGYRPFVLLPDGNGGLKPAALQLDYDTPLPDHIRQNVEIIDLESYIDYIKKFKTHTTAIFAIANDAGAKFLSVLDYHEGGQEGAPKRGMHRVDYAPAYSPEFAAWLNINGKQLTQELFLDHLRKWGDTITNFSDADLIEIASSLDFTVKGEYSSHVERTKGGRKLLFNEQIEGSAQLKSKAITVPDGLVLNLPVFVGGRSYEIGADLLYRPQSGSLRIIVELRRQHLTVRQAVKDIVEDVKEGTGIQPFLGRLKSDS